MPSPDVAGYLGLELVDLDEQDLLDTALADAAEKFPEWEPREGNTEVVLLELLAGITAEQVYAINQLPAGLTEVLLRLFGFTRDQGTPPIGAVTFTTTGTATTIPAGTTVRLNLGENTDPVDLVTDGPLDLPAGTTTGTVNVSGTLPSTLANGTQAGTGLELLDALPAVESVTLASGLTGGTLAEDGTAFLDRVTPRLAALTTTLVRPVDFEAYVAARPEVARVKVLDLFNPGAGGAPGSAPGYVTVAVATAGGGTLSLDAKASLAADLRAAAHAGLIISVVDANVTTVNVNVTVLRYPGADDATVTANVAAALGGYLDPDTWPWADMVRVNELIARADTAAGVDTVLSVTTPSADLTLGGYAPLARLGTVTVTVTAP